MTQTFSVLLAVVRPPHFLPFAIESVLAQSVREFELLIVCDGAPPETVECAREHARRDPRIKVLDFPKGERIGEAHWHNVLITANGRYVAHLEDDDLWFPCHLEELEKLLQTADFGHLLHVWARPDGEIELLPCDLAMPELRQRMLTEKFNRFGFSVCGYRLDAYRRLAEGWGPAPKGSWPDLYMWRKFLRRDDLRFETRMTVTALVLASLFRKQLPVEERQRDTRKWLDRILNEREREKIVHAAWRSVIDKELRLEIELGAHAGTHETLQAAVARISHLEQELDRYATSHNALQAELEFAKSSTLRRINDAVRRVALTVRGRMFRCL